VQALNCRAGDRVLEIGAGEGILTGHLADSACDTLIAVEIDARLTAALRERYQERAEIIQADFLGLPLADKAQGGKIKIIGNIPYYLTSEIIFKILEAADHIECAVLMVQKEVAERLAAAPRTKAYGLLSVFVQARAQSTVLFAVGREQFYPPPKVDSCVVRLVFTNAVIRQIIDYALFREIVAHSFRMRRKMLRNSLKALLARQGVTCVRSVDLQKRPEELSIAQFVALANEMRTNTVN